ncbi:MAG: hypothetical protein IIU05_05235, partial [Bacteroidales bacterium]|nr:hypothetical protein [Bacteroidales bacterium]
AKSQEPKANSQLTMVGLLADLTDTQQTILNKLQEAEDGIHINLLVMELELPYSDVASELLSLELQGLVRSLPGGIYRFVPRAKSHLENMFFEVLSTNALSGTTSTIS